MRRTERRVWIGVLGALVLAMLVLAMELVSPPSPLQRAELLIQSRRIFSMSQSELAGMFGDSYPSPSDEPSWDRTYLLGWRARHEYCNLYVRFGPDGRVRDAKIECYDF